MKENYLYTESEPAGTIKLSEWATKHKDTLGKVYSSELSRRNARSKTYEQLRFD